MDEQPFWFLHGLAIFEAKNDSCSVSWCYNARILYFSLSYLAYFLTLVEIYKC